MMKKIIWAMVLAIFLLSFSFVWADESLLIQFEKAGIWKIDRPNHRFLVDPGVWKTLPFEKKEQTLQIIYTEEKTWWELYDTYSGKLLGKVSSWGWKVYP
jgi:hypothetical protein